jgi:hypothetical protein
VIWSIVLIDRDAEIVHIDLVDGELSITSKPDQRFQAGQGMEEREEPRTLEVLED